MTTLTQLAGRIIGLDYGSKRIGVAVSDSMNVIARSIGVLSNDAHVLEKIAEYVREYSASLIVIGMPYTLRGETSHKGREVLDFVTRLREAVPVEVKTVDERFTTTIAHRTLVMMGTSKKQRRQKERVDEMASALILQGYLDRKIR